jgi:hypothetical protein
VLLPWCLTAGPEQPGATNHAQTAVQFHLSNRSAWQVCTPAANSLCVAAHSVSKVCSQHAPMWQHCLQATCGHNGTVNRPPAATPALSTGHLRPHHPPPAHSTLYTWDSPPATRGNAHFTGCSQPPSRVYGPPAANQGTQHSTAQSTGHLQVYQHLSTRSHNQTATCGKTVSGKSTGHLRPHSNVDGPPAAHSTFQQPPTTKQVCQCCLRATCGHQRHSALSTSHLRPQQHSQRATHGQTTVNGPPAAKEATQRCLQATCGFTNAFQYILQPTSHLRQHRLIQQSLQATCSHTAHPQVICSHTVELTCHL